MRILVFLSMVTSHAVAAQPLSFDRALAVAAGRADVRGTRAEHDRRERLDRRIRRVGGNPQLSLQPGWRTAPSGDEGFELQAQLTQQFSLAGVGRARRRSAQAERETLDVETRARVLTARLEAARAWIGLWAASETTEVVGERRSLVQRWRRLTERAAELGASTTVDAALVAAENGEVEELAAANRVAVQAQRQALARALNLPEATLDVEGAPPVTSLPPLEVLENLDGSGLPSALLAEAVIRREQARLEEIRARAGTTMSVGGQVMIDSPGGFVLSGVLNATLPVFERNQRGRAVQSGALARAEIEGEGAFRDARRLFSACVTAMVRAREAAAAMQESTLPALRSLVTAYARRREVGEVIVFEELAAQRRWLGARTRAIEVEAAQAWAEVRMRLLLDAREVP